MFQHFKETGVGFTMDTMLADVSAILNREPKVTKKNTMLADVSAILNREPKVTKEGSVSALELASALAAVNDLKVEVGVLRSQLASKEVAPPKARPNTRHQGAWPVSVSVHTPPPRDASVTTEGALYMMLAVLLFIFATMRCV